MFIMAVAWNAGVVHSATPGVGVAAIIAEAASEPLKVLYRDFFPFIPYIQGDTSRCFEPPVDIKRKVPFWPGLP